MADTTFTDGTTVIVAAWLNDVNTFVYTNGVDKTSVQTLTNKTLTSPAINTPTIVGGTMTGATTLSATGSIGYTTGAGGTVTQATNKSTGVTLNKICGDITMNGAALANAAEVSFTVTNSTVAATDNILVSHVSAGTAGGYNIQTNTVGAGSFVITVSNQSGGSLSEAIVLRFTVIKGVTA
jgi:hypothetical protein